jgi:hypothetical protein
MSTKLRNIDAIKKMLSGQHFTQTKTSVGYEKNNDQIKPREIGEEWEEDGCTWVQEKGFKITQTWQKASGKSKFYYFINRIPNLRIRKCFQLNPKFLK